MLSLKKIILSLFHGTEDPIFPIDHGKALAAAIPGSTFIIVDGMGHVPNSHFYDLYIASIKQIADKGSQRKIERIGQKR